MLGFKVRAVQIEKYFPSNKYRKIDDNSVRNICLPINEINLIFFAHENKCADHDFASVIRSRSVSTMVVLS